MVHLYKSLLSTIKFGYKRKIVEDSFGNSISNIGLIIKSIILGYVFKRRLNLSIHNAYDQTIGLLLPNTVPTTVVFFAIQFLNKTAAILNFTSGSRNLVSCVKKSDICAVITSKKFIEKGNLEETVEILNKETEFIFLEDIKEEVRTSDKFFAIVRFIMDLMSIPSIELFKKYKILWGFIAIIFFVLFSMVCIGIAVYFYDLMEHNRLLYIIGVLLGFPAAIIIYASGLNYITTDPTEIHKPFGNAVVLYTSGTESDPKGVGLTHGNLYANRMQVLKVLKIKRSERFFTCLPFFHSFGLGIGVLLPILSGCKVFLYPTPLHFQTIPKLIEETKSTVFFSTDTFLKKYLPHVNKSTFNGLKYLIAGAEKVDRSTHEKYKGLGVQILEGYGVTEASPAVSVNTLENYKIGSVGKFIPEIEYKIEKIDGCNAGGLLHIKGDNVINKYFNQEKKFEWYNTGDVVNVDDDGYLFILGRLKRFAKIAGEMISLTQIEEFPKKLWPENNSVVCAIKDPDKGEALMLLTDNKNADLATLVNSMKNKGLSNLYFPRKIKIIDEFPILGSGKLDFKKLQDIAEN